MGLCVRLRRSNATTGDCPPPPAYVVANVPGCAAADPAKPSAINSTTNRTLRLMRYPFDSRGTSRRVGIQKAHEIGNIQHRRCGAAVAVRGALSRGIRVEEARKVPDVEDRCHGRTIAVGVTRAL